MPVSSRLVKINPTTAEKWLEGNVLNRTIKDRHVRFLSDQMKRGLWQQNGSTLVFASDGTLLDGQHRLWACIMASTGFTSLVAEGVDKSTFATIDTGASRTAGDVLHISGHRQCSSVLAAAAAHVMNYRTGDPNSFKKKMPRLDLLAFVNENSELNDYITIARSTKTAVRKHTSVAVAIAYMAGKKHPQQARNFLRKFMTGEDLTSKSPVLALRNRLMAENRLRPHERLALTAYAWNAYIAGKQVSHLKIIGSGLPKIAGGEVTLRGNNNEQRVSVAARAS